MSCDLPIMSIEKIGSYLIRRLFQQHRPYSSLARVVQSPKSIANTSRAVPKSLRSPGSPLPAPPPAGTGSGDHGGSQTFWYARLVFAILLREIVCTIDWNVDVMLNKGQNKTAFKN